MLGGVLGPLRVPGEPKMLSGLGRRGLRVVYEEVSALGVNPPSAGGGALPPAVVMTDFASPHARARCLCLRSNLYRTLTEPYEAYTGAWHTEEDATAVHAVVALERARVCLTIPRLEQAFANVPGCTSYADSPARKGRSLKRIPMVLIMMAKPGGVPRRSTEHGVE